MRRNLQPADLGDLLEQVRNAVLATHQRDGSILLSPVWHEWRDGGFTVLTGANDIKVRQLRRDARASIVVAEDLPPYRGIEVRGEARIFTPKDLTEHERISIHYLGPDKGKEYAAGTDPASLALIRIVPGVLRVWDFADEWA